jgi:transposase-like protein
MKCPECGSEMTKEYHYGYLKYFHCLNCDYSRSRKVGEEKDGWITDLQKEKLICGHEEKLKDGEKDEK